MGMSVFGEAQWLSCLQVTVQLAPLALDQGHLWAAHLMVFPENKIVINEKCVTNSIKAFQSLKKLC